MVMLDVLRNGINNWGVELSNEQFDKFNTFFSMLDRQNKTMNLTTISDCDMVQEKHFLDSLSFLRFYSPERGARILDLGTGAGFPGIPIAIAREDVNFVLVDSLNKRMRFVYDVARELNLNNVSVVCDRAEVMGHSEQFRENFDFCLSRAVASLNILSEYCLPFVRIGGAFVSYKGPSFADELDSSTEAISTLGGSFLKIDSYDLPKSCSERNLIGFKKVDATPEKYPRRSGIPTKRPL